MAWIAQLLPFQCSASNNGVPPAIQAIPGPAGSPDSRLGGVSCRSATDCTAVGTYSGTSAAEQTLAEHWDGSNWAVQPTPNPVGMSAELDAVSCASSTSCTAVGVSITQSSRPHSRPLAEHWDGSSWTIQYVPLHPVPETRPWVGCRAPCLPAAPRSEGIAAEAGRGQVVPGRRALAPH